MHVQSAKWWREIRSWEWASLCELPSVHVWWEHSGSTSEEVSDPISVGYISRTYSSCRIATFDHMASPLPSPQLPATTSTLSFSAFLCWDSTDVWDRKYLFFCVWLISPSITSSMSSQVLGFPPFSCLNDSPLSVQTASSASVICSQTLLVSIPWTLCITPPWTWKYTRLFKMPI